MTDNGLVSTRSRRLLSFGILFLLLTVAGLALVYREFADNTLGFDRRLLDPGVIAGIMSLLAAYFASDGLRLYFTLRALGHKLPVSATLRLVFINMFVSNITPLATGGGLAQIWYMQRHGIPIGLATAATTIRTVLAVLVIFIMTPVVLLTLDTLHTPSLLRDLSIALGVFVALYLGFFGVVLFRTRWLVGPLDGLVRASHRIRLINVRHRRNWQFRVRRESLRFARSFSAYLKGDRRHVALSVLFTCTFLVSLFSFPALLIGALGYDVDYLVTLGVMNLTTFLMYFSPTPGASGISEGVFGSFFRGIIGNEHLLLVTVAWRMTTIYIGMFIGLVVLQRELIRKRSARP